MPIWTTAKKIPRQVVNNSTYTEKVIFNGTTVYIPPGGTQSFNSSGPFTFVYDSQLAGDISTDFPDNLRYIITLSDSQSLPGFVAMDAEVVNANWGTPQKNLSGYPYERDGFLFEMTELLYDYFNGPSIFTPAFKRTLSYLLQEDTFHLLLEDSGKIVLDYGTVWTTPQKS